MTSFTIKFTKTSTSVDMVGKSFEWLDAAPDLDLSFSTTALYVGIVIVICPLLYSLTFILMARKTVVMYEEPGLIVLIRKRDTPDFVQGFGSMFCHYESTAPFFEFLIAIRRCSLVAVAVFFVEQPGMFLLSSVGVVLFALLAQWHYKPFSSSDDHLVQSRLDDAPVPVKGAVEDHSSSLKCQADTDIENWAPTARFLPCEITLEGGKQLKFLAEVSAKERSLDAVEITVTTPALQRQTSMLQVQVPADTKEGTVLQMIDPASGQPFNVSVPVGVAPSQTFSVQVPAAAVTIHVTDPRTNQPVRVSVPADSVPGKPLKLTLPAMTVAMSQLEQVQAAKVVVRERAIEGGADSAADRIEMARRGDQQQGVAATQVREVRGCCNAWVQCDPW